MDNVKLIFYAKNKINDNASKLIKKTLLEKSMILQFLVSYIMQATENSEFQKTSNF